MITSELTVDSCKICGLDRAFPFTAFSSAASYLLRLGGKDENLLLREK